MTTQLNRSVALKELHSPFVLLGGSSSFERPEFAPPAGVRIVLPRIQAIPAGLELANHVDLPFLISASGVPQDTLPCHSVSTNPIRMKSTGEARSAGD